MKKNKLLSLFLVGISIGLTGCGESNMNSSSQSSANSSSTVSSSIEESVSSASESSVEVEYTNELFSNPTIVTTSSGTPYRSEVADPSIVKGDDGFFYIFATNGVVLRSTDACNFELFSTRIIDTPTWWKEIYPDKSGGFGIWAPDVVKVKDKWIYYYSLSAWGACAGVGYAISDNIAGPYEDQGKLFSEADIGISNCIDPQVIVDDGNVYMAVGSFQGLFLLELTEDGTELLNGVEHQKENKTLIAGKVGPWDGSTYEGSYIIKRDGFYYYFGSAGTCCVNKDSSYHVLVGRSESIYGPYVGSNGIPLTKSGGSKTYGDTVVWAGSSGEVAGPGHNSILVDDKGDCWIYYHSYSSDDNFSTRHLFMDKLAWDEKGFPYVSYVNPDTETEVKKTPSLGIELDGPSFIL